MGKTDNKFLAMIHKGVAKVTEDKMLTNQPIKYEPLNHKYRYSIISIISVFMK